MPGAFSGEVLRLVYPTPRLTERRAERNSPFIPWSFEPAGLQPR